MIVRPGKTLIRVAVAALSVALGAYGFIIAYAMYQAHRATDALDQVAKVNVGDAESSLLPLVREYKGVKRIPDSLPPREQWVDTDEYDYQQKLKVDYIYEMSVSAFEAGQLTGNVINFMERIGNEMSPSWRRRFRFRIWSSILQFSIRDGRVQSVSVRTLVEGRNQWLGHFWSLSERMPRHDMKARAYLIGGAHLSILAGRMYGGSAVTNYLTPTATDEEQHAARDFNHSCIIGLGGCTDLEDLAPKAFDYCWPPSFPPGPNRG
jgi:hypothetical protein